MGRTLITCYIKCRLPCHISCRVTCHVTCPVTCHVTCHVTCLVILDIKSSSSSSSSLLQLRIGPHHRFSSLVPAILFCIESLSPPSDWVLGSVCSGLGTRSLKPSIANPDDAESPPRTYYNLQNLIQKSDIYKINK